MTTSGLHGPAGVGKTLAANVCLRELERTRGEEVCRIAFRPVPLPERCVTSCSPRSGCRVNLRVTRPSSIGYSWTRWLRSRVRWSWTKLNG